jgi:hypothetical protein
MQKPFSFLPYSSSILAYTDLPCLALPCLAYEAENKLLDHASQFSTQGLSVLHHVQYVVLVMPASTASRKAWEMHSRSLLARMD